MTNTMVRSEEGLAYGMYRFFALPCRGDRISVSTAAKDRVVLDVLYVMHNPVQVPSSRLANPDPIATVVVRLLEDRDSML